MSLTVYSIPSGTHTLTLLAIPRSGNCVGPVHDFVLSAVVSQSYLGSSVSLATVEHSFDQGIFALPRVIFAWPRSDVY
eukprot:960349-Rhodomonas_salina.2